MKNKIQAVESNCRGGECGFGIDGEDLGCTSGGAGCNLANLLEAESSAFHDTQLAEATKSINDILAKIPPDKNGRKASFINTKRGILLAWVDHNGTVNKNAITQDSDEETLATALKLKKAKT